MNLLTRAGVGIALALVTGGAVARATVFVPVELDELARDAQVVVHGRVSAVRAGWVAGHRRIDSLVTVDVHEYFKGDFGEDVTFRVPGGQVGRYRSVTVGAPVFHEGDEVVVFLRADGPSIPYLVGLTQGVYRVVTDPASGRRLVTPPSLGTGAGRVPVRRGDADRRPAELAAFGETVRRLAAGGGGGR